ncbi:MAG: hypothetical protein J0M33_19690 [Anaerolineae bacterium]|nr:hypothetical protein [Anaerolineae bacterium]
MEDIDKRGVLKEAIFDYQMTKDGKVLLFWKGKQVKILAGKEAEKFSARMADLEPGSLDAQLIMAKVTGNFKRGNERQT